MTYTSCWKILVPKNTECGVTQILDVAANLEDLQ
jgi:hypothetical protein